VRILAIRGKNLASLYGEFEVRLDEGPIAEAGLFCISGPTGAGKSTILDALCLALYGRTPRTRETGGVLIGREDEDEKDRIAANDSRSILSRGTGEGYAEVDFEGQGGRFRARWSVWRANKKPGGRLQDASLVLRELGSERPIGEKFASVRAAIEARVGYTFDEFCRAVLLPQFEFTAFLRAKPDERAAILERVTGKELYSAISVRAHERASTLKRGLDLLREQVRGTAVLDAEARAALDAEVERREAEVVRIGNELGEARQAVEWHERAASLARELGEAEAALAAARERDREAEPRRAELAAIEAAQPLRGARDEAVAAGRRAVGARLEVARLAEAAERAAESAREARLALDTAETGLARARTEAEAVAPELERAKGLDRDLAAARAGAADAAATVERAAANVEACRAEVEHHAAAEAEAIAARDEAGDWLEAHRDRQPLADGWTRWEAELTRHGRAVAALAAAEAELAKARREHGAAVTARERAAAVEGEHEAREREATAAAEGAEAAAGAVDRAGLAARREELAGRVVAYAELARLAESAVRAAATGADAMARLDAAAAALAEGGGELARVAAERSTAEGRLAEARDALEVVRQSLGYEDARATLREGDPCPLCGSVEHPWAHGAPVALVEDRKARVTSLERSYRELGDRKAEIEKHLAVAKVQGERARTDADAATAERDQALAGYDRLARLHDVAVAPDRAGPELARLGEEADGALAALQGEEREANRLVAEAGRLRKAADAVRKALELARTARLAREREAADLAHRVEVLEGEHGRAAGDRDAAEAQLAPVLAFRPGFRDEARRSPGTFLASCRELVRSIGARRDALAKAEQGIAAAARALEGARARFAEREGSLVAAGAARDAAVALRDRLVAERQGVLGGRATADVERLHREAVDRAERTRNAARSGSETAGELAAVARNAHAGAVERADAEGRDAMASAGRLAAALAAAGLDRATLDLRLTHDHVWITRLRTELTELGDAVNRAATLRDERSRKAADHDGTGRPPLALEPARERCARGAEELAAAERDRETARFRRRADDAAREGREKLAAELAERERAAAPWEQLAGLIGSADGKKFRLFAQGLAFDLLLAGANRHLAELARRYRLARVPDTDLDLQVIDQDLGDEVRSVNGLSGGETFLVSLALALGLATLSTKADHAKTLFIDEGFGTLDRDTLDHAMVALEGLQSAGRTVGVISHVPEMHERVGVRVEVERVAVGRSRVAVRGPG
jgi:exonuclease SbcC